MYSTAFRGALFPEFSVPYVARAKKNNKHNEQMGIGEGDTLPSRLGSANSPLSYRPFMFFLALAFGTPAHGVLFFVLRPRAIGESCAWEGVGVFLC